MSDKIHSLKKSILFFLNNQFDLCTLNMFAILENWIFFTKVICPWITHLMSVSMKFYLISPNCYGQSCLHSVQKLIVKLRCRTNLLFYIMCMSLSETDIWYNTHYQKCVNGQWIKGATALCTIVYSWNDFFRLLILILLVFNFGRTQQYSSYRSSIPNGDNVPNPCQVDSKWEGVGHQLPIGGSVLNPFGLDLYQNKRDYGKVRHKSLASYMRKHLNSVQYSW